MFEQLHSIPYLQKKNDIEIILCQRVQVSNFVKEFIEKTHHVHLVRWQDEKFKMCKDTFPHGTVLSVLDLVKNYTLKPKNEIQSQ